MASADQRIEASYRRLIFMDGVQVTLYRQESPKGKPPKSLLHMVPPGWVIRAKNIKPEELSADESNPMAIVRGVLRRAYNLADMVSLSDNPEFPMTLMLCNFEGGTVNVSHPELANIMDMKSKIDAKEIYIASLEARVKELSKQLQNLSIEAIATNRQRDRVMGVPIEQFISDPAYERFRMQNQGQLQKKEMY